MYGSVCRRARRLVLHRPTSLLNSGGTKFGSSKKQKTLILSCMRVFCLYRPNTEQERAITELNRELLRRINRELELISVDTVEGDNLAQVYDITQYPAVVVTDSAGVLQHSWTEGNLPLINELSYYLQQD